MAKLHLKRPYRIDPTDKLSQLRIIVDTSKCKKFEINLWKFLIFELENKKLTQLILYIPLQILGFYKENHFIINVKGMIRILFYSRSANFEVENIKKSSQLN